MATVTPQYFDSAAVSLSTGADHWFGVTSTGTSVVFIVDGTVVDTVAFPMRLFRGVALTDLIGCTADNIGSHGSPDGTPIGVNVDARRERTWGRVLTLAELTAEAASSTPIVTGALLSNVGLTSTSDLTDSVAGRDFTTAGPIYTGSPTSSGDGYIRFSKVSDTIRRSAPFLDLSRPFSLLWHQRVSSAPSGIVDLRLIGNGAQFEPPYVYLAYVPGGTAFLEVATSWADSPQIPIDQTVQCCCSGASGGGTSAAGDILPVVDPAWTRTCTGGGIVPTAADLANSEDWSA